MTDWTGASTSTTSENNITPAEVRHAGGWETEDISDAALNSDAYIPVGDAWLHTVIGTTLSTITDSDKSKLLEAAEIHFVAHLVVLRPPKSDFSAGPFKEKDITAVQRKKIAKEFLRIAEDYLVLAGYTMKKDYNWKYYGGDDYHPDSDDNTNIDFGLVDSSRAFNWWGND